MKAAKLFVEGSEYCDFCYDSNSMNANIKYRLDNMSFYGYDHLDEFEWHAENENGEIIISGIATVNYTPSVTIKVDDD